MTTHVVNTAETLYNISLQMAVCMTYGGIGVMRGNEINSIRSGPNDGELS